MGEYEVLKRWLFIKDIYICYVQKGEGFSAHASLIIYKCRNVAGAPGVYIVV